MSKKNETAGKPAKKCAAWRTVKINGRIAERSPDGRTFYGTAQEVRDAGLMPWRRQWLAESLKVRRMTCPDREYLREVARELRRDAVRRGWMDAAEDRASVAISSELLIWATAAARANGQTVEAWAAAWLNEAVNAELDEQADGTLPLTRHELAALERIGAKRPKNRHRSVCA